MGRSVGKNGGDVAKARQLGPRRRIVNLLNLRGAGYRGRFPIKAGSPMIRDTINHWVHHRGQMTVYLRLMDVPVPGTYGPSADERF